MLDRLSFITVLFGILGIAFFVASVVALKKRRFPRVGVHIVFALLMLSLSGLFGTISIATQGYRALIREEVAAVVVTEPAGHGRFRAHFRFPDGRAATFELMGDALYIDAHILKWRPIANLLGLHTSYELDRVTGRYTKIQDERRKSRTVFSLADEKPVNMFKLRRLYPWLKALVDAEYGSATFVTVNRPSRFRLLVSTSGLFIREITGESGASRENRASTGLA